LPSPYVAVPVCLELANKRVVVLERLQVMGNCNSLVEKTVKLGKLPAAAKSVQVDNFF